MIYLYIYFIYLFFNECAPESFKQINTCLYHQSPSSPVQVKPFLVVLFKISGSSKLGPELGNDITMGTGLFTAPMVQCVRAPALH